MSEELTTKDRIDASKLLLSGFLTEIIGGMATFLIVIIIGTFDPFLAAFLIILTIAASTLGCGLVMLWFGNPYNLYWKKAKGIYEDVKDGSLDAQEESNDAKNEG